MFAVVSLAVGFGATGCSGSTDSSACPKDVDTLSANLAAAHRRRASTLDFAVDFLCARYDKRNGTDTRSGRSAFRCRLRSALVAVRTGPPSRTLKPCGSASMRRRPSGARSLEGSSLAAPPMTPDPCGSRTVHSMGAARRRHDALRPVYRGPPRVSRSRLRQRRTVRRGVRKVPRREGEHIGVR